MGRNASHGEPRRMNGQDAAGPSPFEACPAALSRRKARAPQGDGDRPATRGQDSNPSFQGDFCCILAARFCLHFELA